MKHTLALIGATFIAATIGVGIAIAQDSMSNTSSMSGPMTGGTRYLCPTDVKVVLKPTPKALGWMTNNSPVSLSPDSKNLPRVESGEMICYYAMPDGYNAFTYFRSTGGKTCTVNASNTGFVCH